MTGMSTVLTITPAGRGRWVVGGISRATPTEVVWDAWRREYVVRLESGGGPFQRVKKWSEVPNAIARVIS